MSPVIKQSRKLAKQTEVCRLFLGGDPPRASHFAWRMDFCQPGVKICGYKSSRWKVETGAQNDFFRYKASSSWCGLQETLSYETKQNKEMNERESLSQVDRISWNIPEI